MPDPNPFAAPDLPAPVGDREVRTSLLPAEARVRAIGLVWMAGAAMQAIPLYRLARDTYGVRATAGTRAMLSFELVLLALQLGYFLLGYRLRALTPVHAGLLVFAALVGIVLGPAGCANLVVPLLLALPDSRRVLTSEHAELRRRTRDLQPEEEGAVATIVVLLLLGATIVAWSSLVVGTWGALVDWAWLPR